jgi:hypothetical protein
MTASWKENYLSMVKCEYDICVNHHLEYEAKVCGISISHNLRDKRHKLMSDVTPLFFMGEFDSEIVWFTLNGHYAKGNTADNVEEVEARKGWNEYLSLFTEIFKRRYEYLTKSIYYQTVAKVLGGITGETNFWDCLDRVLTLEAIPYRSVGTPSLTWNTSLNNQFLVNLDLAKMYKRKLLVFNGKIFVELLCHNGYDVGKSVWSISNKNGVSFNVYLFKISGIQCVLFGKFLGIPARACGVTDKHLSVTIPDLIKEELK